MLRYILKRILWMIPIVLGVAIIVFTLMYFCPGDPATILLGSSATQSDLAAMREQLGLNHTYLERLGTFLFDTFIKFDFGNSWITRTSIKAAIIERLPRTMLITISTLTISIVIGISLGIMAAINQGKWKDNLCMAICPIRCICPGFLAGFAFDYTVFSENWGGCQQWVLAACNTIFCLQCLGVWVA